MGPSSLLTHLGSASHAPVSVTFSRNEWFASLLKLDANYWSMALATIATSDSFTLPVTSASLDQSPLQSMHRSDKFSTNLY